MKATRRPELATWEQLTHAEIAVVVLDCSANAVGIRLHRARQRLSDVLAQDSDESGHTPRGTHTRRLSERQL